jgi:hypothetical protein
VPRAGVRARAAARVCRRAAATYAPPRTGYANQRLREAAGDADVWLDARAAG